MANSNSLNTHKGRAFQERVKSIAERELGQEFQLEKAVKIGLPPKDHKFDLVSEDNTVIIECKCYGWTESGNVPSAKMATLDETILFMRSIPYYANKIVAMSKEKHPKRGITLAEYFVDKHGHLLADIAVWEIDEKNRVRVLKGFGGIANDMKS